MGEYPANYAHLVRDALLTALPWLRDHIKEEPQAGDLTTELRIEIPSQNPAVDQPYVIETSHREDGINPPQTGIVWWSRWSQDPLLTEPNPQAHLQLIVDLVTMFLSEKSAAFNAWREGRLTSGGTLIPPDAEPFPSSEADSIQVRSWRGTFDRDLSGNWPGWPNDPTDPFYKTLGAAT